MIDSLYLLLSRSKWSVTCTCKKSFLMRVRTIQCLNKYLFKEIKYLRERCSENIYIVENEYCEPLFWRSHSVFITYEFCYFVKKMGCSVTLSLFGSAVEPAFHQILIYFFLLKLSAVCTFWIVLMCWCQKWFLKNKKNIIGMYFGTKSYLKSNHYHTAKHPLYLHDILSCIVDCILLILSS
jgi:hypothetical protein